MLKKILDLICFSSSFLFCYIDNFRFTGIFQIYKNIENSWGLIVSFPQTLALYYIYFSLLSSLCLCLSLFSLYVSLSLSHTHTHTRTRARAHAHMYLFNEPLRVTCRHNAFFIYFFSFLLLT